MPKERVICGKLWERRITNKLPEIRKRVSRFFFCAPDYTPKSVNTDYTPLDILFFYLVPVCPRLHFTIQTTQCASLPNFASPVKILKKQQEVAGTNTRLLTLPMPTIEKRENATTISRRLHRRKQHLPDHRGSRLHIPSSSSSRNRLPLTFPPPSSRKSRLHREQQQERGHRKQQTTLASNVAQPTAP